MRTRRITIGILTIVFAFVMCGVSSVWAETNVHVQQPGTLSSLLTSMEKEVKITGSINGSDVKYLREQINNGNITSLNLSDALIVSGGDAYYEEYTTSDGVVGEYMFSQCKSLTSISLPNSITEISSNAFSRSGLKKIEIPDKVSTLGFDAFAYCNALDTVALGRKTNKLEQGVFYGSSVKMIYVRTSSIPAISYYLCSSNPTICVYSDMKDDFAESDWNEFGTIVGNLEDFYPQEEASNLLKSSLDKYFDDKACTILKSEYSSMSVDGLKHEMENDNLPEVIANMIMKIRNDSWASHEKEFRINEYKAYSDANYWNREMMATGGSYMGNPTGIYASDDSPIYIFVDQDIPSDASLYFAGCLNNELISNAKTGQKLTKGLNVVDGQKDALYYVVYTADTRSKTKTLSEWPDIKIHIEGGVVNGYYDVARHSDTDYVELLNNATHGLFTIKGGEALFNFKTSTYKTVWPNSIKRSICWFDSLTVWEKELMGFCESVASGKRAAAPFRLTGGEAIFPIYYNNPNFALEGKASDDGYANSCPYRTSYNSVDCIRNSFVIQAGHDDWCVGHECGHNNQGAINLESCTEVSNNLFSNVICYLDGETTTKGHPLATTMNYYAHHVPFFSRDVTSKMRMYYQLYLYYHQAEKNTAFYPTLFQELRNDPLELWTNTYNSSLKFVRKVCEVAQEDLTDFFTAWGFFEPCNLTIDDYGIYDLTVTQADIDKTLEEISKYPKKNREILFIEDRVEAIPPTDFLVTADGKRTGSDQVGQCGDLGQFTDFLSGESIPSQYTYTQADSLYAMSGTGGIGFVALNSEGKMVYAANALRFCIPSCIDEEFTLYSVDLDGTMHEVTKSGSGMETVSMTEAGTLSDLLSPQAIKAKISGPINGTDIKYLRQLVAEGNLQSIDLSEATIVSGGDAYYETYTTSDDDMGAYSFYNHRGLISLILPQTITSVGSNAFAQSGLMTVQIPDNVISVGMDAFAYCSQLSTVEIGTNVKSLNQGVFYSSEVKHVYVKAKTPPTIGNYLFSSKPIIHVYAESLAEYEASAWAEYGTLVGDLEDYENLTLIKDMDTLSQEGHEADPAYDLFGRRVSSLQPYQVYVRKGRKVVVFP
ncbi:MAG: leucine-rich repeat protein [Paludibacteraceae bacterium]|nr:leucine-rich repeat protein [Paludibacteraceae bacterium]